MRISRVIATALGVAALAGAALVLGQVSATGVPQAGASRSAPAESGPAGNHAFPDMASR
jgi:hypothetical protein